MTDVLIRRAEHADLAAIVQLRREWTQEEGGDIADPDYEARAARASAQPSAAILRWSSLDRTAEAGDVPGPPPTVAEPPRTGQGIRDYSVP